MSEGFNKETGDLTITLSLTRPMWDLLMEAVCIASDNASEIEYIELSGLQDALIDATKPYLENRERFEILVDDELWGLVK
jgi:hypothetical protein